MKVFVHSFSVLLAAGVLASCRAAPPDGAAAADSSEATPPAATAPAATAIVWPSTLRVMGDGYPRPGDACRRLGESPATANLLDDSAVLVGCPGEVTDDAAAALVAGGGRAVGTEQGITLISIPQGDANAGMSAPTSGEAAPPIDAARQGKPDQ